MKFLICGSRNWKNEKLLRKRIKAMLGENSEHTIINGGCRGADVMSTQLAKDEGWTVKEYPADWKKYKKAAGPIRNQQMIIENPDLDGVIAFSNNIKDSKGTQDMVFKANYNGIPVVLVSDPEVSWGREQEKQLSQQMESEKDGD